MYQWKSKGINSQIFYLLVKFSKKINNAFPVYGYLPETLIFLLAIYLFCIVILNYGFATILIGPIPLYAVGLFFAFVLPFIFKPIPPLFVSLPIATILCYVTYRLIAGQLTLMAARDAITSFGLIWIIFGFILGHSWNHKQLKQWGWSCVLFLAFYWALIPFQELLRQIGPSVGLHGNGLFGFYQCTMYAGIVFSALILWPNDKSRKFSLFVAASGIYALLYTSGRVSLLVTIGCVFLTSFLSANYKALLKAILSLIIVILILILIGFPSHRYGKIDWGLLSAIPASMVGIELDDRLAGAALGFHQRIAWWYEAYNLLETTPSGWFVGIGFGKPLTDHSTRAPNGEVIPTREFHNSFLSAITRLGAPIGLLMISLFFGLFCFIIRPSSFPFDKISVWYTTVFLTFFMNATNQPSWENVQTGPVLWFLLGLGLAIRLRERKLCLILFKLIKKRER